MFGGRETSGRLMMSRESEVGRDLVLTSDCVVYGSFMTKTVIRRRLSQLVRSFANSRVESRWLGPGKGINTTSAFFILEHRIYPYSVSYCFLNCSLIYLFIYIGNRSRGNSHFH